MNEYFFRVKYTARDEFGEIILENSYDFKEDEYGDYFKAKDRALESFRNREGLERVTRESYNQGIEFYHVGLNLIVYLVEVSDDGREIEHPWMGAYRNKEEKKLVKFDREISLMKRKEINAGKSFTLEDYQKMEPSDPLWTDVPVSYQIIKTARDYPGDPLTQRIVREEKHHDYSFSRRAIVEKYEQLIRDPKVKYSDAGIANFDEKTGVGYVLDLYIQYTPTGGQITLYSPFKKLQPETLDYRKEEKFHYDYYGFAYPGDVNKKMPWL